MKPSAVEGVEGKIHYEFVDLGKLGCPGALF
jgi:hypothetical protein